MTASANILERYAIRASVALAAASSQGSEPEIVIHMREDAAHLAELCVAGDEALRGEGRQWCDDVLRALQRWMTEGLVAEHAALSASVAVLRLRLMVGRSESGDASVKNVAAEKKALPIRETQRATAKIEGNQKKVLAYVVAHPDARTGALIAALAPGVSPRTVKRCLKELVAAGLMRREKLPDGGVSYVAN
ncbi:MAG: hypothetical protein IT406_00110 [Candidatus Yanofskybacteria bacterium]|nr:hypothetical protein [Candidatus Yanofskybacteria bacterium]